MPEVLVLGADGFIGSHLCDALVSRDLTVRAFDRFPGGSPRNLVLQPGVELIPGDFLNRSDLQAALDGVRFVVKSVTRGERRRNPAPPFITSTLQQEAGNMLGFTARKTMTIAQQLYEGVDIGGETTGLITYMRTDGVTMAREAIAAIREHVGAAYGADYVPGTPREYTSKAKNAQEAHEAVRPTDVTRTPDAMARYLSGEQLRLYELVWRRAVAWR